MDRTTKPGGRRNGWRAAAGGMLLLMLLSAWLAPEARADACSGSLYVRVAIAGCELRISDLGGIEGAAGGGPTVALRVAGVECTYKPLCGQLGVDGMLRCLQRVLRPFVHIEDS